MIARAATLVESVNRIAECPLVGRPYGLQSREVQIVARAGNLAHLPVWPQLVVERCRPGFRQRLRVRHRDVELEVIAIDPAETFGHLELIAVRMAQAIQPGLLIEAGGLDDERRV